MADEQARDAEGKFAPPPEPSYRERLRQLDEEDEAAAKSEYESRLKAREAAKKAPLTVQATSESSRGTRPEPSVGRALEAVTTTEQALDDSRQAELRRLVKENRPLYRT